MKKYIKSIAITAAASGMLLASSASSVMAADQKFAVVNFQEVMSKIPQSAAVMAQLQTEFKDEQAVLAKLEEDIKYSSEKKKRDGSLMSVKDKAALDTKIATMYQEYQAKGKIFQQKSGARQNEETNKIVALVRQTIDKIAAEEKYDFVLEQKALVFSTPKASITTQVIEQVSKLK